MMIKIKCFLIYILDIKTHQFFSFLNISDVKRTQLGFFLIIYSSKLTSLYPNTYNRHCLEFRRPCAEIKKISARLWAKCIEWPCCFLNSCKLTGKYLVWTVILVKFSVVDVLSEQSFNNWFPVDICTPKIFEVYWSTYPQTQEFVRPCSHL